MTSFIEFEGGHIIKFPPKKGKAKDGHEYELPERYRVFYDSGRTADLSIAAYKAIQQAKGILG